MLRMLKNGEFLDVSFVIGNGSGRFAATDEKGIR